MQKNVTGQKWIVFAFDETDNTPKTGDAANITGNLRLDGGAANAIDDTNPTELEDGYYIFDITQAESNADLILISPESSTANIQVIGVPGAVWTRPPNFQVLGIESDGDLTKVNTLDGHTAQTGDSFSRIGANGASLSALPWNSAWDVEVESEVADALVAFFTSAAQLVDDIWDEILTAATHNIPGSAGRRMRDVSNVFVLEEDTAQAGTAGTITLAVAASAVNDFYEHAICVTTGGTGAGQARAINGYNGGTKVATIVPDWKTNPDATTTYTILADTEKHVYEVHTAAIDSGSFAAGAIDAASLNADAATKIVDDWETQSQADPTGFHVNVKEVNGTAQTANDNSADINTILSRIVGTILAGNHTAQSGDSFTRIGANGAGLSALPWNASWDAEVQSEVQDALEANNLDHLMKTAVANNADMTAEVTDGTVLSNMLSKTSDTSSYTVADDSLEGISDTGGGDATAANQTTIITHLTDVKGAGFVGATDSNEAIRNRGDAAWVTGGGIGGASTVTITVVDGASAAIQDCSVQIWNTALDSLVSYGTTDANGQIQLSADDGSYKVKLKKGGFSFTDPEDLTVSGTTTQTYTGASTNPSAPASAQSCRVYDYLFLPDGSTPVATANTKARIISLPEDANSILHSGAEIEGTYNSTTGLVYWDVVKGAEVEFTIIDFGIRIVKTVPTTSTARLVDIT